MIDLRNSVAPHGSRLDTHRWGRDSEHGEQVRRCALRLLDDAAPPNRFRGPVLEVHHHDRYDDRPAIPSVVCAGHPGCGRTGRDHRWAGTDRLRRWPVRGVLFPRAPAVSGRA